MNVEIHLSYIMGTDKEFNEFKFKGEKLTALGYGYYFTQTLIKPINMEALF